MLPLKLKAYEKVTCSSLSCPYPCFILCFQINLAHLKTLAITILIVLFIISCVSFENIWEHLIFAFKTSFQVDQKSAVVLSVPNTYICCFNLFKFQYPAAAFVLLRLFHGICIIVIHMKQWHGYIAMMSHIIPSFVWKPSACLLRLMVTSEMSMFSVMVMHEIISVWVMLG